MDTSVKHDDSPEGDPDGAASATEPEDFVLANAILSLGYIPDFLPEDLRFWFCPNRQEPKEVQVELVGRAAESWESYYSKKGWAFVHGGKPDAEGPYQITSGGLKLELLDPGRFFAPKPVFRWAVDDASIPVVSLEKRRPINPWKPTYIRALNFIKKYEWKESVPGAVHNAIWEIEECGEIAGSTSWHNAEQLLHDHMSPAVIETLADVFYNRPEDFPLGSEVYLRVLGQSGDEGFEKLLSLARHPISRKRRIVAQTFGALGDERGSALLLELLVDEDPEVLRRALRSLGQLGVDETSDPKELVKGYLDSDEIPKRVWAAQALYKGGDESFQKFFLDLVKQEPRLLTDMGELGDVLADLDLFQAMPFLINRLKHDGAEFRADAAESIEKLTGVVLDYASLDSQEERRNAIRTCNRWWDDYKRSRRKGGG